MNQPNQPLIYDLIIVGAGPAGLTASIYASRYKLKHLVVGKLLGGTITLASKIENYPGFTSISGLEWAKKTEEQIKTLGAEVVYETVERIEKIGSLGFRVLGEEGKTWETKTIIIATGSERRKLNIPGEDKYLSRGVSYCTTCDAPFFRGKTVCLIGGADAAVSGAVHAAEFAQKVYIIYRGEALRAEPIWVEQALKHPKIEPIYKTNIVRILGYEDIRILSEQGDKDLNILVLQYHNINVDKVVAVELDNPHNGSKYLRTDGVFIEIGGVPGTSLVVPLGVVLDQNGFVKVGEDMSTNVPGLFCAGDLTTRAQVLVQMTTACAQGAIAAASAYKFLKKGKAPKILGGGK